jgi:hypothetical protein
MDTSGVCNARGPHVQVGAVFNADEVDHADFDPPAVDQGRAWPSTPTGSSIPLYSSLGSGGIRRFSFIDIKNASGVVWRPLAPCDAYENGSARLPAGRASTD